VSITKLRKLKSAIKSDVIVYQPGRVGSTTICHALDGANIENTHLHTFGFNSVYFVRENILKKYINYVFNIFCWKLIKFVHFICGRKTLVFVPLRAADKRNRSVEKLFFDYCFHKYYKTAEYKSNKYKSKSHNIARMYERFIEYDGQEIWLNFELYGLLKKKCAFEAGKISSCACGNLKVVIFDIELLDEVLEEELGIATEMVKHKNQSKSIWYHDFLS